jgi:hypothetical protein
MKGPWSNRVGKPRTLASRIDAKGEQATEEYRA